MTKRRTFMKASVASGILAILTTLKSIAALTTDKETDTLLGAKQLEKLVGSYFELQQENGNSVELKFSEFLANPVDHRLQQFYLYFQSDDRVRLEENSYRMFHPELGQQLFFLQPLDDTAQGSNFRASLSLINHPQSLFLDLSETTA